MSDCIIKIAKVICPIKTVYVPHIDPSDAMPNCFRLLSNLGSSPPGRRKLTESRRGIMMLTRIKDILRDFYPTPLLENEPFQKD
jgi:hypothetical protein